MKKAISLLLALVMVFALAACGEKAPDPTPTPDAGGSVVDGAWNDANIGNHTFILAHGMAETSQVGLQYHEFALAVAELSGGKMIVEEKIAGTLLADTETLDGIMDGTIDFAHSMGGYVSGTVTDISPLTIAGYYGGSDWLGFARDTRSLISDIYDDYGIKYLGALYQGNSAVVSTERQIKAPSDVAGLTFRASGTWISKTVEAWGGAATTIGLADLSDAFSKKTVQGTATGLNIIVPFKIYEVAKYITFTSITEGFAALIMNGDTWAGLNADEQALIEEAGKVFEQKAYDIAVELAVTYVDAINAAGLNEVYTLTAAEQQEFIKLAYSLFPQMEPELGTKGIELITLLKQINGIA
ncbi:MAG: TRAP transporter substrate-binding protein DctP [Oscillospiraceae bacterium]|jgi:TRAP-type C4-dicarboxylate transport system substrate-binding protein|nr:TRAP transporter substrate-binding protein DctP [Oscillospiraceae bacterium]